VINLRMKGCGLYWCESTAEGLIHLRCQLLSGHWSDFIRTTLTPEHNPVLLNRAAWMPWKRESSRDTHAPPPASLGVQRTWTCNLWTASTKKLVRQRLLQNVRSAG